MPTRFVPEPDVDSRMSRAVEVRTELDRQQSRIAQRARSNLAGVRDTGAHHIATRRGAVDRYVQLEGPAPLSIEAGHYTRTGTYVPGHHILSNA